MKTFYRNEDGRIRVMQTANDKATAPNGWTETENHDFYIYDGETVEWFDNEMKRIPDSVLVEKGKRLDNRGHWYRTGNPHETITINNMDEEKPGEDWTLEVPIENEPFQNFEEGKWVVDTQRKERAEKEAKLTELKSKVEGVEKQQYRSFKAIRMDKATKDDTDKFYEYEAQIEDLRSQISGIEKELKSA
jgi:hypothetical protein